MSGAASSYEIERVIAALEALPGGAKHANAVRSLRRARSASQKTNAGLVADLRKARDVAKGHEIRALRMACRLEIERINMGLGAKTPGFRHINQLLRRCDALFAKADEL